MNDEQWRGLALDSINKYMPDNDKLDSEAQHDFAQRMYYCQSDFNDREGYQKLAEILERLDRDKGTEGNRMYYLATPPPLTQKSFSSSVALVWRAPLLDIMVIKRRGHAS